MDGQGIIAVAGRSEVHLLNPVGTRIFELIDGQRDMAEITRIIESEFEVAGAEVAADVEDFLADMRSKGGVE